MSGSTGENLCPGCGEPPATSREGQPPGHTVYRCANGHDWENPAAPEPEPGR